MKYHAFWLHLFTPPHHVKYNRCLQYTPFGMLDDLEDEETIELAVVLDPMDRERVLSRDFLFDPL